MQINLVIYRKVKFDHSVKWGNSFLWEGHVCFRHSIPLAMAGLVVLEEIDNEHDEFYVWDDQCIVCAGLSIERILEAQAEENY